MRVRLGKNQIKNKVLLFIWNFILKLNKKVIINIKILSLFHFSCSNNIQEQRVNDEEHDAKKV